MNKINNIESSEKQKNVYIREANIDDAFAIAEINYNGWRTNFRGIIDDDFLDNISLEKKQNRMIEFIKNKNSDSLSLVAVVDGKVVWFVHWGISRDEIDYEAEIYAIYIDPDYQWKWIGKNLMDSIIQTPQFKNAKSFYLRTLRGQKQTRHFYEKMWWKVCVEEQKEIWWKLYPMVAYCWKK